MNDKQFDAWIKTVEPIGCLHKRHPEYRFAPVFKENGKFVLGPNNPVPVGLEVRQWNREVFVV